MFKVTEAYHHSYHAPRFLGINPDSPSRRSCRSSMCDYPEKVRGTDVLLAGVVWGSVASNPLLIRLRREDMGPPWLSHSTLTKHQAGRSAHD